MQDTNITAADVVRAYVALIKRKHTPSVTALHQELGKGNRTAIAQHLRRLALRHPRSMLGGTSKVNRKVDRTRALSGNT